MPPWAGAKVLINDIGACSPAIFVTRLPDTPELDALFDFAYFDQSD